MTKRFTSFLQTAIVLLGVLVLGLLLWWPHIGGGGAGSVNLDTYLSDPFLAYVYLGSLVFFFALYKGFRLLGYVATGEIFSEKAVGTLRKIKYSALVLAVFIVGAEFYFFAFQLGKESIIGEVVVGLFLLLISAGVVVVSNILGSVLSRALDLKSALGRLNFFKRNK